MSTEGLENFRLDLTEFMNVTMPGKVNEFCRDIANNVLTGVVTRTPVKTGLARGNWQVTEGNPASGVLHDQHDKTGDATLMKGRHLIDLSIPIKRVVWITNNVPYIVLLEDGNSQQAPNGMVEVTLDEIKTRAILAIW